MKKIAIITDGFGGSSTSLVEALLQVGCQVDLYIISGLKDNWQNYESFNPAFTCQTRLIYRYKEFHANGLRRFLKFQNRFAMYFVRLSSFSPYEKSWKGVLKCVVIPSLLPFYFKHFKSKQYEVINVIGQTYLSITLSKMLKGWGLPVIHSLHEVLANHLSGNEPYKGIDELVKSEIPVILFSQQSKETFLSHFPNYMSNVYLIPFSLFTGYLEYSDTEIPEISNTDDYLLYYGYIRPYKGLSVLYKALPIDFIGKVVVAGIGDDPILEEIRRDSRFILVNRWVGNAELATLIRHSRAVVCPYLSSSQSGIPVTVYNFDKPIIATKVPAFANVIETGVNGYLVDVHNAEQLREAICKVCLDEDFYQQLKNNLVQYHNQILAKQWGKIAAMYLAMIPQIK
jgi:glycosyltransferase involved in cell wall biosynthesis